MYGGDITKHQLHLCNVLTQVGPATPSPLKSPPPPPAGTASLFTSHLPKPVQKPVSSGGLYGEVPHYLFLDRTRLNIVRHYEGDFGEKMPYDFAKKFLDKFMVRYSAHRLTLRPLLLTRCLPARSTTV